MLQYNMLELLSDIISTPVIMAAAHRDREVTSSRQDIIFRNISVFYSEVYSGISFTPDALFILSRLGLLESGIGISPTPDVIVVPQ
jgi:hypothetical protein